MQNGIYNIKSLFALGDVQQLVIPEVQRDYVWEEKNCNRLFHSIKHGFDNRKIGMPDYINTLPDEKAKTELINKFIEDNSRINLGFIYAYHDNDYIGKQFIIDGQQRFTTIFLMLLACYKNQKKNIEFKNNYFKNNIPKLDYKVRESSHDFLVELIKDQCEENSIDGIEERLWWRPDFYDDITVKNLKNNYRFLLNQLDVIQDEEKSFFLEYLEKNIDFKFFDIAISEQGEQLYLFMNSRGVRLNFQEKIRAEIIAKHGIECGNLWEDAQQYFWEKKMNNKDSELGFNEFLKWTVIIHIATKGKEIKNPEQYISRQTTDDQLESLESYFIENVDDFDRNYIQGIFNATKYYFDINSVDSIQNNPIWLTSPDWKAMPIRIYLKLLPVIYYIFRKQSDGDIDSNELRRVSAFILNCNQSRTYQKNPQSYLINFIRFIRELCDNKSLNSIMEFDVKSNDFIGRDFSKLYFEKYKLLTDINDKLLLEDFVIKMIIEAENKEHLKFLFGDYRLIIEALQNDKDIQDNLNFMNSYSRKLSWFYSLDYNTQRKLLLTFGDYSYQLSDVKYDFGQKEDIDSWREILANQSKRDIFISFLNNNFTLDDAGIEGSISNWFKNNPISTLNSDDRFKYYLIKYDFDKNYFAWGWGDNEFTIRTHTVRKSGYNYSIDIINYAVAIKSESKNIIIGWVDGSRDLSEIKILKNDIQFISMRFKPSNWEIGNWILKNNLEINNKDYSKVEKLIQNTPQLSISKNEDIVEIGKNILEYFKNNI
jgi:uncharacterized protein with ParB-like and HNH nuclease domain